MERVHGMEQCNTDPCVFNLNREVKVVLIVMADGPRREYGGSWPKG